MNGVVYVAYGKQAEQEARLSIASLKRHNNLPVTVITKDFGLTPAQNSRMAKVSLPELVDYERVLYLDADTRVRGDISAGFEMLDNWDLAITASKNQGYEVFKHIHNTEEKEQTLRELGNIRPLQLQAGVMFFHRERCTALFAEWRRQWQRWQDQDQAALLRALAVEPVRVWLLGRCWNGGELVEHLFGRV